MPLAVEYTNADVVRLLKVLTFEQLITRLTNTQLVENGFTQRDLALASLVTFHHLDLSRALLGHPQPTQQRKIQFGTNTHGEPVEAIVYPGLTEQQFQAIIQFAHTERWPMTSQGLFIRLRKQGGEHDPSLADAFFLTSEFLAVEILFNRAEVHIDKTELLSVSMSRYLEDALKFCGAAACFARSFTLHVGKSFCWNISHMNHGQLHMC